VLPASANAQKPVYGDGDHDPAAMTNRSSRATIIWAYVNGSWDKNTQIAATAPRPAVVTLSTSRRRTSGRSSSNSPRSQPRPPRSAGRRFLFEPFMDTAANDAAGTAPLSRYLAQIQRPRPAHSFLAVVKPGYASPFDLGIDADLRLPIATRVRPSSGPARMPSPRYYLTTTRRCKAIAALIATLL